MKLYGRNWRLIQVYVGTRNATQARSHAQKYFAKLRKNVNIDTQETTSAASPMFKPETSLKNSTITLPDVSSQNFGSSKQSKDKTPETSKIFSVERKCEERAVMKPQFSLETQKRWLSEHYFIEPDYIPPPTYEPVLLLRESDPYSIPLQEPDSHFFCSSVLNTDSNNEENECSSLLLSKKYPTLSSLFE